MKSSKTLAVILVIFAAAVLGVFGYILTRPKIVPSSGAEINKIEISADKKSILNAETKKVIFAIEDAQKYLRDSGYFYNPDTFQTTNAKYEGGCFLDAALSNGKDRIVFSTGCLPGDLPQAWVGVYTRPCISCASEPAIKFLTAGSGRNFAWSQDDKTITYEADLGLSGMAETRTIDAGTGEILGEENGSATIYPETKDWQIYRDEKCGFEINYPSNFKISQDRNEYTFVVPENKDEFRLAISPMRVRESLTLEQFVHNDTTYPEAGDFYRDENIETIDGITIYRFTRIFGSRDGNYAFFLKSPDEGIEASYISGSADYGENPFKREFDQILSTFRFIKPQK